MVQLSPIRGFSLCASVQQGGKYDNNLKYMHRIIRFVVNRTATHAKVLRIPTVGLRTGRGNDSAIFMLIAFSSL